MFPLQPVGRRADDSVKDHAVEEEEKAAEEEVRTHSRMSLYSLYFLVMEAGKRLGKL